MYLILAIYTLLVDYGILVLFQCLCIPFRFSAIVCIILIDGK